MKPSTGSSASEDAKVCIVSH